MTENTENKIINKFKILLIDDDEISSNSFVIRLRKRGFDVHFKNSGINILEFLAIEKFNLIFLDINMPDLCGHDVLKSIRSTYSQLELPVIMLSGKDEVQDIVDSLKIGANDYIVKPANIDIAMARLNTQLMQAEFLKLAAKKKELETINAMVVTYSHEINNPLTIALGHLDKLKPIIGNHNSYHRIENSLQRIIDIIAKINSISENSAEVEFESYSDQGEKILKIKKTG